MNTKSKWKQYLFVIRELTDRELKRKYSRSKLGIIWSILNPLLNMVVLSFIFSTMFHKSIENYPVYYLCGTVTFNFFSGGTSAAMTALEDNKNYLIKLKIPMRVFVISRVYTALVNFAYSLIAFIPILLIYQIKLGVSILFLPVIIGILLIFVLGISYMLSVACVFFGDIRHLWGIFTTLLLFMSAIFYPLESLSLTAQRVVSNNPLYLFVKCMRNVIYQNKFPSTEDVVVIAVWAVVVYVIGLQVFRNNRNRIIQKL